MGEPRTTSPPARAGLPQGACTSPGLSNQVAIRLDRRLGGLARKLDLSYTRYADDLTFSGDAPLETQVGYVMARLRHIASEEGFAVNEAKSRVLRQGASAERSRAWSSTTAPASPLPGPSAASHPPSGEDGRPRESEPRAATPTSSPGSTARSPSWPWPGPRPGAAALAPSWTLLLRP